MYHYRINEIRLHVGEPKERIPQIIQRKLRLRPGEIREYDIRRESIDARKKDEIRLVYTVDFRTEHRIHGRHSSLREVGDERPKPPESGNELLTGRPVVVGFGPCGIFAALELAKRGYRPIVLERGDSMEERVRDVDRFRETGELDPESNVLFGEGGAGTFSDGKLTSGIRNDYTRYVLETFAEAGAGEEILWQHRPHIGTDVLREVIVRIRKKIESYGGEIRFRTHLESLDIEEGQLRAIRIRSARNAEKEYDTEILPASVLILATGHSARDTFEMLHEAQLPMEPKPLSIGVRMEHPQELIDRAQYGAERRLPPADYKLSYKASNGRGVYSFCMCPGGEVIVCSTANGELCVNGMSNRKRDSGTANSGILCDVRTPDFRLCGSGAEDRKTAPNETAPNGIPGDSSQNADTNAGANADASPANEDRPPEIDVLAGVRFQQHYERKAFRLGMEQNGRAFAPPHCTMEEFLSGTGDSRYVCGALPEFASESIREAVPHFARKIQGYDKADARITAVETRSSSPVRILRDTDGQSAVKGIYPAGEGAGYAGGITSAACDGIRAANHIIERFAPPEQAPDSGEFQME